MSINSGAYTWWYAINLVAILGMPIQFVWATCVLWCCRYWYTGCWLIDAPVIVNFASVSGKIPVYACYLESFATFLVAYNRSHVLIKPLFVTWHANSECTDQFVHLQSDWHHYNRVRTGLKRSVCTSAESDWHHYNRVRTGLKRSVCTSAESDWHHYNRVRTGLKRTWI